MLSSVQAARILRGLRIVGRLGLHISEETATAIGNYSSSILSLGQVKQGDTKILVIGFFFLIPFSLKSKFHPFLAKAAIGAELYASIWCC